MAAVDTSIITRGQVPAMITKIHSYLVKEVNLAENAEEISAEFVNKMCQITLEAFLKQNVKEEEGFDRTDTMLEGLGAGWTVSSLANVNPSFYRYLTGKILKAVTKLSIVETPAMCEPCGIKEPDSLTGANEKL